MIPLAWLMCASDDQLLHFEVARLNKASVLEKEIKAMKEEADEQRIEAGVARWLLSNRQELLGMTSLTIDSEATANEGAELRNRGPIRVKKASKADKNGFPLERSA